MSKIGIYPGSFDPITYGHLDIIQRSLSVVDELVIAVSNNKSKDHLISIDDRLNLINQSISSLPEKDLIKIWKSFLRSLSRKTAMMIML